MTTTEERLSRLEGGYEHVATKADISDLRGELRTEIAALRGELKTEISDLRNELKSELHRWMYRLLGGLVLTAVSLALVNIFT